jgi:hypothetical protein
MKLKTPDLHLELSMKAYNNFSKNFNKDIKILKHKLKNQHNNFFYQLVKLYGERIIQKNNKFKLEPIDPDNLPRLNINRAVFANLMQRDVRTISAYIQKFIKLGIINKKISHGPTLNFDLYINPDFLVIFDKSNPDFTPKSKFLELADFQFFKKSNRKSFQQFHVKQETKLNNKIINVEQNNVFQQSCKASQETFSKGISSADVSTRNNLTRNTREYEKSDSHKQEKSEENLTGREKISNLAAKKTQVPEGSFTQGASDVTQMQPGRQISFNKNLENLKILFSSWLLNIAITIIWRGKNIHPSQIDKAFNIIYTQYFTQANDPKTAEMLFYTYKQRVEMAARNIQRNIKPENLNIYPEHYFDVNNKKGFAQTAKWHKNYTRYKQQEKHKKIIKSDTEKLSDQFKVFIMNPNMNQFNTSIAYIKKNIPHMENIFLETISEQQGSSFLHHRIYEQFSEFYNQQYVKS